MQLPESLARIWNILTPEQQSEVSAELSSETSAESNVPAKTDASTFAEHNLPDTPAALGCQCAVCVRVRAAA